MKQLLIVLMMVVLAASLPSYAEEAQQASSEAQTSDAVVVEEESSSEEPPALEPEVVYLEPERVKRSIPIGLMVGMYNPTDMKVKEVFGQRWVRFGIRPLLVKTPDRWRPTWDVSYYSMMHSGNRATVLPLTGGFIRGFAQNSDYPMFVSLNAGPCYYKVNSPVYGVNKKGWGLTTNATVGVTFGGRLAVEGRYEFMDEFGGFDFSAFTISTTLKLFNARL